MLIDGHGRPHQYLRLAITDKCNLRCRYCMPEKGLDWIKGSRIPSTSEVIRFLELAKTWGISKVRFTGGEPFMRKDFPAVLQAAHDLHFDQLSITTNGLLVQSFWDELTACGVRHLNFSLDTLDEVRFQDVTKRNGLPLVKQAILESVQRGLHTRINCVLLADTQESDMLNLIHWSLENGVDIRFLEEMPFNGQGQLPDWHWNWRRVEDFIFRHFPQATRLAKNASETADTFCIPGYTATLGYIASFSRTFCGTCNRIRITPDGNLFHCLYSSIGFPLLEKIRQGLTQDELSAEVSRFLKTKSINGFEAEKESHQHFLSMAKIGG